MTKQSYFTYESGSAVRNAATVVFGVAIAQRRWSNPSGTQRFTNATWDTKQVGPVWQFSVMNLSVPSAVMTYDRQSLSGGASP